MVNHHTLHICVFFSIWNICYYKLIHTKLIYKNMHKNPIWNISNNWRDGDKYHAYQRFQYVRAVLNSFNVLFVSTRKVIQMKIYENYNLQELHFWNMRNTRRKTWLSLCSERQRGQGWAFVGFFTFSDWCNISKKGMVTPHFDHFNSLLSFLHFLQLTQSIEWTRCVNTGNTWYYKVYRSLCTH